MVVVTLGLLAAAGAGAGFGAQRLLEEPSGDSGELVRAPVAAFDCPGGVEIGELHGGDRVLITARGADGWLRIRDPFDVESAWWVPAGAVGADESVEQLDLVDCGGTVLEPGRLDAGGAPVEEASPEETTTTVAGEAPPSTIIVDGQVVVPQPSPGAPSTTAPSVPRPRPGPTVPSNPSPPPPPPPPSDTTGPALTVAVSPADIWELDGGGISCGTLPRQATLAANVSDPSGIAEVRATWSVGNYNENKVLAGGATRTTTIGAYPFNTIPTSQQFTINVTVTARDGAGNTTTRTTSFVLHSTGQCFG